MAQMLLHTIQVYHILYGYSFSNQPKTTNHSFGQKEYFHSSLECHYGNAAANSVVFLILFRIVKEKLSPSEGAI